MVARVIRKNPETGQEEILYQTTRTAVMHWATVVGQLAAIGAMILLALQFGVTHECKDVIDHELAAPGGSIYMAMGQHRMTCKVDESIRPMEGAILRLETIFPEIRREIRELKTAVERLEELNRVNHGPTK